jgi:hypothetical protein
MPRGKAWMAGASPAMTMWQLECLKRPYVISARSPGHDGILQTHGPTKDAISPCLIVIGFHPNPV